jgi:hypothetical protein
MARAGSSIVVPRAVPAEEQKLPQEPPETELVVNDDDFAAANASVADWAAQASVVSLTFDALDGCETAVLVRHLFLIVDVLATNLCQNPRAAIDGFHRLTLKLETVLKDKLDTILLFYAENFALREPNPDFHRNQMGPGRTSWPARIRSCGAIAASLTFCCT